MDNAKEEILARPDKKPLTIYLVVAVLVLAISIGSLTATIILKLEVWFYVMDGLLAAGSIAIIIRCAFSLIRLPQIIATYKDGVFNFYPVKKVTFNIDAKNITWVSQLSYAKKSITAYGKIIIEHKDGEIVLSYVRDAALVSLEIKKRCPIYTEPVL